MAGDDPLRPVENLAQNLMNEPTEQVILAKELPISQFLKLAFFGTAQVVPNGSKLVLKSKTSKMMKGIAGGLPFIFLGIFIGGFIELSWPNVIVFLIVVVGVYVAAIRSAELVEKEP